MTTQPAGMSLGGLWSNWWRVGGVAGILFLVLFIIGIIVQGDLPTFDDPVDDTQAWLSDNGEQYLVGNYLITLAFVLFFLPFLASLRGVLAAAEGGAAVWSRVAFAGGFLFLIIGATSSVFLGSLAYSFGVVEEADESAIRTLQYLDFFGFTNALFALVPFFLASSLVIWQTGVFWRWLGLVGLLLAVLAAIAGASYFGSDPEGGVAVVGFIAGPIAALWLLVVSIAMIMKQEAPASSAA